MMKRSPKTGFFNRTRKHIIFRKRKVQKASFAVFFETFQHILTLNNRILELISGMGDKLSGEYIFDSQYIVSVTEESATLVYQLIAGLNTLSAGKYQDLFDTFHRINEDIREELSGRPVIPQGDYVIPYARLNREDEDIAGSKNANLCDIQYLDGIQIPEGFAVTARAFASFMIHNKLWERIESVLDEFKTDTITVEVASSRIREMIRGARIPSALNKALTKSMDQLTQTTGDRDLFLAIRSSAWGEDTQSSFAGQYRTFLNEPAQKLLPCYQGVLESAYSASAMEYRRQKGYSEKEVIMAVGCQIMVNARVSGVMYTVDPTAPDKNVLLISALWGLGSPVVEGQAAADQYQIHRDTPHDTMVTNVAQKTTQLVLRKNGGTETIPTPPDNQEMPCLSQSQCRALARIGIMMENHFKSPQDIEFAVDQDGRLIVLQVRPLSITIDRKQLAGNLSAVLPNYHVLFDGKGVIAQRGVGVGPVYIVDPDDNLENIPSGAILVARDTSPRFAKVIRKVSGIITDVGSPTGHMATIAREFRVPTIVNIHDATKVLTPGRKITLDAEENKIYDGIIKELCHYSLAEERIEETYEYRLLRRILKKISLLNLIDPTAKNFIPSACRTFHDITRFVHEKAVEELIHREYYYHDDAQSKTGKLKIPLPIDLILIDFADGLIPDAGNMVTPDRICSLPMTSFVQGLLLPGAWSTEPMAVDLGSFMSSMTRTFSTGLATPQFIGRNMAIISKTYAHISLRLGYHFNMIDAYISENINGNYVYFRFMGGVTDATRRSRRAQFLSNVLARNDFRVEVQGDLVVARIKKLSVESMQKKLYLLGVLVSFSRQLDVQMTSDAHVNRYADIFNRLVHENTGGDIPVDN